MNQADLLIWTKAIAKLRDGLELDDAEGELVAFYGDANRRRRPPAPRPRPLVTRSAPTEMCRAWLTSDKLEFS